MSTLREKLFATNPYEAFESDKFPLDLHGWGSQHPIFRKMIEEAKPRLIVEVGTWKGASAMHMAQCLRDLNLEAQILCVDTWLGALEFWTDHDDPQRYLSLRLENGFPHVFYQFLANVVKCGFQETIVPFPQTSAIAARWLRKQDVHPELIYVDASHEEDDVFRDLCAYWEILAEGGIMFGDDYDQYWPSVRSAVRRFSRSLGLEAAEDDGKWIFRKPLNWRPAEVVDEETRRAHVANTTRFEVICEQLAALVHGVQDAGWAMQALRQDALLKDQHLHAAEELAQSRGLELAAKEQELQSGRQQLQTLLQQAQATEDQLRASDANSQAIRQELAMKDHELQARRGQVQTLQAELLQTQFRLNRWENWFHGVLGSRTWRWVARHTVGRVPLPTDT